MKMLRNLIAACTVTTALLLSPTVGKAQKAWITTSLGVGNYRGDLSNGYTPAFKPAFSVGATYALTERYRLRSNFTYTNIAADDQKSPTRGIAERNLNFKSQIIEFGLMGEYDLLNSSFHDIVPYVFGGASIFHFDPSGTRSGASYELHKRGTEGQYLIDTITHAALYPNRRYNLTQFNLQFGGGIRYEITEGISIGAEISYRQLFTDYLDDVSSDKYVPAKVFTDNIAYYQNHGDAQNALLTKEAYQLSWTRPYNQDTPKTDKYPRGNPNKNDAYYTFQIRLNIRLNNMFMGSDMYSPSNPKGRGQLRCARRVL
ncbi:DUF6089 family protein [Parasediminibacterium sp. JCM 36343]|uniref:DUF6089 family protein n=1 Tax=Parasediminibacterium sp. JCM 36343 TaxID=3374279 RepID=UPI003979FC24